MKADTGSALCRISALLLAVDIACASLTPPSACYTCVSPSSHLLPSTRWQLKAGDGRLFIHPFNAESRVCHEPIVKWDADGKFVESGQLQLCIADAGDMCVTMAPNVKGLNFTLRGCYKSLVPYSLQRHPTLVKAALRIANGSSGGGGSGKPAERCYLLRGRKNPLTGAAEYPFVMCLCRNERRTDAPGGRHAYCNGGRAPGHVSIKLSAGDDRQVIELASEPLVSADYVHSGRTEAIYEVPLLSAAGRPALCERLPARLAAVFALLAFSLLA